MKGMPLNKYGVPIYRHKNIPCRCNKCQTRKTLAKYPEEYRYGERKCVTGYCEGLMKVDRYRLQAQYDPEKYIKDSCVIPCRCNGHPRIHPKGKVNFEAEYCCQFSSEDDWMKLNKMIEDERISQEQSF